MSTLIDIEFDDYGDWFAGMWTTNPTDAAEYHIRVTESQF